MAITIDYAQPLRVIGQALEILKMESFELEPDGDDFVVRGNVTARGGGSDAECAASRNLRFRWGSSERHEGSEADLEAAPAAGLVNQFDLCYTLKDVDRLERQGQARRGQPPGVTATANLSQLLRTIGAYLEEKPARLVKIVKDGGSVTVVYETLSGIKFEEKIDGATLRDWEAQMFNKRTSRGFN